MLSRSILALAILLAIVGPGRLASQSEPLESDLEQVERVELAQVEVTAWPKSDQDFPACRDLAEEDFELIVNGRQRQITAVDWLGSRESLEAVDGVPVDDPANPPLTIVLFFDLWHLNIFYRVFDCPMTKPLAFEEARKLVRSEFRPGDRLLLVTFGGWPQIHQGWIRDPEQALRELDRLEVNPFVLNEPPDHLHHLDWIEGMKSLMLAMGRYPGRKEIFYLGDDFRFDDVALQVFELAARAQANQVSIHAVDLLESCRILPGLGCQDMFRGGLGCTPFRHPIALGFMSANTGGGLFDDSSSLSQAVQRVRRLRSCRYLLSFPVLPKDGKHPPKITVRLRHPGLRLEYPASFGDPRREPSERERQNALFLLPRFGQGLQAEIGLWPLRPSGKRKRWKGIMLARLERAVEDPWPEELERIEIQVVAHRGSKIYGEFGKVIEGDELRHFHDGQSPLLLFPVEGIRPGLNEVALRAVGVGGEVSANVRSWLEVPEPPGAGETGPWLLVDKPARIGDHFTVMPALDGRLPRNRGSLVLAYGCLAKEAQPTAGRLLALDGDEVLDVTIGWLEEPPAVGKPPLKCGWLAGRVEPGLESGLWRFEAPESLTREGDQPLTVEFRVTPEENALPVE